MWTRHAYNYDVRCCHDDSCYVVPVLIIVSVLSLIARITTGSSLFGMVGFLILFMLPVAIISSRIMWKKNIIKVVDKEENAD